MFEGRMDSRRCFFYWQRLVQDRHLQGERQLNEVLAQCRVMAFKHAVIFWVCVQAVQFDVIQLARHQRLYQPLDEVSYLG